ncbi:MAG: hypothetical protein ACI4TW_05795, partial [Prevotella sp.]
FMAMRLRLFRNTFSMESQCVFDGIAMRFQRNDNTKQTEWQCDYGYIVFGLGGTVERKSPN